MMTMGDDDSIYTMRCKRNHTSNTRIYCIKVVCAQLAIESRTLCSKHTYIVYSTTYIHKHMKSNAIDTKETQKLFKATPRTTEEGKN